MFFSILLHVFLHIAICCCMFFSILQHIVTCYCMLLHVSACFSPHCSILLHVTACCCMFFSILQLIATCYCMLLHVVRCISVPEANFFSHQLLMFPLDGSHVASLRWFTCCWLSSSFLRRE
jgi:hypothetical protein